MNGGGPYNILEAKIYLVRWMVWRTRWWMKEGLFFFLFISLGEPYL